MAYIRNISFFSTKNFMKTLLLILFFISASAQAQQADFIMLKKHNKTVTTFYSGMHMSFTSESGAYLDDAYINGIKNDTLYVQQFIIQYLPTNIGTFIIDTVGSYHYKYDSGREGEMCRIGFSPRKQNVTVYIVDGFEKYEDLMSKLGKFKTGKSCLYFKKLSDIDEKVLNELIELSVKWFNDKYGKNQS